jgi:integrase
MSAADLRLRAQRYIALRRAVGFHSRPSERLLLDFIGFVESRGFNSALTAQIAVEWACLPTHGGHAHRLSIARGFLAHLRAAVPDTQVPAAGLLRRPTRPKPHIYSVEEVRALLREAHALGPSESLRPLTYATLIGLLASCGLRVGEAVRLTIGDVQLDATVPQLHIARPKFRKSRLVALHSTTAAALRAYALERHRLDYDGVCNTFFVSEKPGPLQEGSVRRTFAQIGRRAGLRSKTGRGPRLQDLRHTFAVGRLLHWYREGADVLARLPELSIYLGHVRPEDTYWYLSATPQLLTAAADRFEAFVLAGATL